MTMTRKIPQTLTSAVDSELVIRKSRFVGRVEPVTDRPHARVVIAALRADHPGATHVCWALLAGGDAGTNDDGEPGGTAGRPMLDVLRLQGLEGVLATVVRYFGGVKLGAGGLSRAYSQTIATALRGAPLVCLLPMEVLNCVIPYELEGLVRRELALAAGELLEVSHGTMVSMQFRLDVEQAQTLRARLDEMGQGRLQWQSRGKSPT